jgi:hypothetical protein
MQSEMNVCAVELTEKNNSIANFHGYEDIMYRKNTSNNMDKLWFYFHSTENYPEYYLGIAKRVAICKDPGSGKEDWINADHCLSVENPSKGSIVTATIRVKGMTYTKDLIFIGWTQTPIHEWRMKRGDVLRLEQKFIDGLSKADKRFLRIHNG